MKKMLFAVVMALYVAGFAGQALAMGTKADAEVMVKSTISSIKTNGKDMTFAEINGGKLNKNWIYPVILDEAGTCLAHGANQGVVGKNIAGMKDPDGISFVQNLLDIAKSKGSGWVDFKYSNPETNKIEPKTLYIEKYEDVVVSAGTHNFE